MNKEVLFLVITLLSVWQISVADQFYSEPDTLSATLSPDGMTVASILYGNDHNDVAIVDVSTGKKHIIFSTRELSDRESHLNSLVWIDNQHLALNLSEEVDGISNLLDTRHVNSLVVIDTRSRGGQRQPIKEVRTKGRLVHALPSVAGEFIFSKQGAYSRLFRIKVSELTARDTKLGKLDKIDGGQFVKSNELLSLKGYVTRWFFKNGNRPDYALLYNNERNLELIAINEEGEKSDVIKVWTKDELKSNQKDEKVTERELLLPFSSAPEEGLFYSLNIQDAKRQKVFLVNYETGEHRVIYETSAYKVIGMIYSKSTSKLVGVRVLKNGRVDSVYFDSVSEKITNELYKTLVIETSGDGRFELTYTENFNLPGTFTIHDTGTGKHIPVGSHYPKLGKLVGQQEEGQVDSNGIAISYFLNTPPIIEGPFPLIVMPHGGPVGVFDDPSFDLDTQFFVSMGFAVLRVNFRGSGGFDNEFEEAGKLQWGTGMLEDIQKAALRVADKTYVNENQVCSFGASYGGYAALMLSIKFPDFYQCAVSLSGLTDLTLRIENTAHSKNAQQWMKEQLLTTEQQETMDLSGLLEISPTYRVPDMRSPIMVLHGSDDEVVDIEHANRLKLMLEKYKHSHQFKVYEGADHSLSNIENTRDSRHASLKFIMENISVP